MPIFAALFSWLGSAVTGFFNFKKEQSEVVKSALDVITSAEATDGQVANASATVLSAMMNNGSFLEKNWRPTLMLLLIIIITSWFFGYLPPHFNDPVSPMMDKILTMLMIGLGGYLPLRSVDKWVQTLQIGSIIKTLIQKRLG